MRNDAIACLTETISQVEGAADISAYISQNICRSLKEPIKSLLTDLRSQQVRDVCAFLIRLAVVSRDQMRLVLRDVFPILLDALKVPNKVMSGYVDNCILEMVKLTAYKPAVPLIMAEIRDCKNKLVRER